MHPLFSAMSIMGRLYGGDIGARITVSRRLFDKHGTRLKKRPAVREDLARLIVLAQDLEQVMADQGLPELCAACACLPAGGCCSAEMANEADGLLLVMNRLLDCPVRPRSGREDACRFLGETGCSLALKPMFCINYNCAGIRRHLAAAAMSELERRTGLVLQRQYSLEMKLLDVFRRQGVGGASI